jgi:hypothetical protein
MLISGHFTLIEVRLPASNFDGQLASRDDLGVFPSIGEWNLKGGQWGAFFELEEGPHPPATVLGHERL